MASQRGRARVAEKPRGGFVFGSSTPRELSYVRGAPSGTRSADASSSGSPSAGEKQHSLSYYMRQARSITPSCSDRSKGWAFGSSTPRQFSHLSSIKPELRVYDVKIQTKSARSHTAPSIHDRPPKAPSAAPKPRPPPAPMQKKAPQNDDVDSVSSEPDFREHRTTFKAPAGKQPNCTATKKMTSSTVVRKTSSTTKTPSGTSKTTTLKKTSTATSSPSTKKVPSAPAPSPVPNKSSATTPEKIPTPGKRKASGVEHFAPGLPLAAEQEHMVPKAVHTGHEDFEAAVSSVPSVTTHNDTSEVMQEDSNIEELVEQKHVAQSEAGNIGGIASNVAEKISEVLNLANQKDEEGVAEDIEERFEQKIVEERKPAPTSASNNADLFGGIGAFISSASEKIRDVVHDAESHGIDVAGIAEKGVEMFKEQMSHEETPKDVEEECIQQKHDFTKPAPSEDVSKSAFDAAGALLEEDVVEKAIGFVQNLKEEPTVPGGKPVDQVDEDLCEQRILAPHTGAPQTSEEKVAENTPTETRKVDDTVENLLKGLDSTKEEVKGTKGFVAEEFKKAADVVSEVVEAAKSSLLEGDSRTNDIAQSTVAQAAEVLTSIPKEVIDSATHEVKKTSETVERVSDAAIHGFDAAVEKASDAAEAQKAGHKTEEAAEATEKVFDAAASKIEGLGCLAKEAATSGASEVDDFSKETSEKMFEQIAVAKETASETSKAVASFGESVKDTVSTGIEESEKTLHSTGDALFSAKDSALEGIHDTHKKIFDLAGSTKDTVVEGSKNTVDTTTDFIRSIKDNVSEGLKSAIDDSKEGLSYAVVGLKQGADTVAEEVEEGAQILIRSTNSAVESISKGLTEAVDSAKGGVEQTADTEDVEKTTKLFREGTKEAGEELRGAVDSLIEGAQSVKDTVSQGAKDLGDTISWCAEKTTDSVAEGAQSLLGAAEATRATDKVSSSFSKFSSFFGGKE
ncbi:hypothetical protein QR680_012867 [Steinernema hermaphroditum]|uniref:Uncharacterized protein n=1 Tax=Steinernema hermaphroditum TaxID=289476 RepID=A0AA39I3K5_9BILA|nr:hypothetical protein QR680_012867 [Steinernema hermaphroditum]